MIMVSEVQNSPVVAIQELSLDWDSLRRAADGGRCQDLRSVTAEQLQCDGELVTREDCRRADRLPELITSSNHEPLKELSDLKLGVMSA